MQIVRATGAERSHVKRILLQERIKLEYGEGMEITPDLVSRFFAKVDKGPGLGPDGDCWIWEGALDHAGYPKGMLVNGKVVRGTHMALAIDGKPRPDPSLIALHSCDNRPCVNPAHLRWGTEEENQEDHRQRGKRGAHWLPDETVHEIHRSKERNCDIAKRLGLSQAAICSIRKGRSHRSIYEHYCPVPEPAPIA